MNIDFLVRLSHHRWNFRVLAQLHERNGAKFVTLANDLACSRSALSASLNALIQLGLVRRNAGYGHPMRPEYLLTVAGQAVGDTALSLREALRRIDGEPLGYKKWSVPLVVAIDHNYQRFQDIRGVLAGVTPRALALSLKDLEAANWVERSVTATYPPVPSYALAGSGRRLARVIGETH